MATPLKKGDRIVAVPDGEGGTDAVDFVVIENRPRGHGLGVPIYMPNAVTVSVKRADDDAVLVSSTYGTVTASKPEEATEEFSGQLSYPNSYYRRKRAMMGDIEESHVKFVYKSTTSAGGPAWFVAEFARNDDVKNGRG